MYEDYIERFRNLSYLEDQLEHYNGSEQDKEAVRDVPVVLFFSTALKHTHVLGWPGRAHLPSRPHSPLSSWYSCLSQATEAQLKRMQVRMQEVCWSVGPVTVVAHAECTPLSHTRLLQDEMRMMRGDDEDFGDLEEDPGEESDLDDNDLEECVGCLRISPAWWSACRCVYCACVCFVRRPANTNTCIPPLTPNAQRAAARGLWQHAGRRSW